MLFSVTRTATATTTASEALRGGYRSYVRKCGHGKGVASFRVARRNLLTLAIETSCDDTSVAIVEKHSQKNASKRIPSPSATLHFLDKITADTSAYQGIHPIAALESHQENLADLVDKALGSLPVAVAEAEATEDGGSRSITRGSGPNTLRRKPDFISVTRGPGMRSNLATGLEVAKGLAVAWQVPIVGVHHMQAHLLTPRLVSALAAKDREDPGRRDGAIQPEFPFFSILASGGHSQLVNSKSIVDHEIIATTTDIAIGDALDKVARIVLPDSWMQSKSTMYGKILEEFAFPNGAADHGYVPPATRGQELIERENPWGWSIATPLANRRTLEFSFSGVESRVKKLITDQQTAGKEISHDERVAFAREAMTVCFEHLASRTVIALEGWAKRGSPGHPAPEVRTLVISGGVAANKFLMTVLRSFLDVRGFQHVEIIAPPPYLCTDNAAMIGWTGIEMFEQGWHSPRSMRAIRKWSLDTESSGVFSPGDWLRR